MSSDYVVYATFYPGVEKYALQWKNSVLAQTDKEFDLALGLDVITPRQAQQMLGADIRARFLTAPTGSTPAGVRNHAFLQLVEDYKGVIMTDMDDLLLPERVRTAKASLSTSDLGCCAMQVMDADCLMQDVLFDPGARTPNILVGNVFGLGNTAYRSRLLKECLPVPASCVLMDWLIATRALASGAAIAIDRTPQMVYRQYPNNTARILQPFSSEQILKACELVLGHYDLVHSEAPQRFPQMLSDLEHASGKARHFFEVVRTNKSTLHNYVLALNGLATPHVWWDCVAHPELENVWSH